MYMYMYLLFAAIRYITPHPTCITETIKVHVHVHVHCTLYIYYSLVGVGDVNTSGRDFLRACASDTRSDLFLETSSTRPACLSSLGICGELGGVEVPDGFLRITISCTGLRLFGVVPRERGLLLGVSSWLLE